MGCCCTFIIATPDVNLSCEKPSWVETRYAVSDVNHIAHVLGITDLSEDEKNLLRGLVLGTSTVLLWKSDVSPTGHVYDLVPAEFGDITYQPFITAGTLRDWNVAITMARCEPGAQPKFVENCAFTNTMGDEATWQAYTTSDLMQPVKFVGYDVKTPSTLTATPPADPVEGVVTVEFTPRELTYRMTNSLPVTLMDVIPTGEFEVTPEIMEVLSINTGSIGTVMCSEMPYTVPECVGQFVEYTVPDGYKLRYIDETANTAWKSFDLRVFTIAGANNLDMFVPTNALDGRRDDFTPHVRIQGATLAYGDYTIERVLQAAGITPTVDAGFQLLLPREILISSQLTSNGLIRYFGVPDFSGNPTFGSLTTESVLVGVVPFTMDGGHDGCTDTIHVPIYGLKVPLRTQEVHTYSRALWVEDVNYNLVLQLAEQQMWQPFGYYYDYKSAFNAESDVVFNPHTGIERFNPVLNSVGTIAYTYFDVSLEANAQYAMPYLFGNKTMQGGTTTHNGKVFDVRKLDFGSTSMTSTETADTVVWGLVKSNNQATARFAGVSHVTEPIIILNSSDTAYKMDATSASTAIGIWDNITWN